MSECRHCGFGKSSHGKNLYCIDRDERFSERCGFVVPNSLTGLGDRRCMKRDGHDDDHEFKLPRITSGAL